MDADIAIYAELSYAKGADAPPLLEITIGQALDAAAARWGSADALVSRHQAIRWSWASLCGSYWAIGNRTATRKSIASGANWDR